MWHNNPSIVTSTIEHKFVMQNQIRFVVQSQKKVQVSQLDKAQVKSFRRSDVFLEPFEPGICIEDELTQNHRLLFNKFPARDLHVMVVTKSREKQTDFLNPKDFSAILKTMKSLDGFAFYNSGIQAGASQDHKHIQVIPYSSLPYKKIPIHDAVKQASKSVKIDDHFVLQDFQQIRHTFKKLDPYYLSYLKQETLQTQSEVIHKSYRECIEKLQVSEGKKEVSTPYNLILTKEWMLMVIRRRADFDQIPCNSLGFIGLLWANNEEQKRQLEALEPIELLRQVAQPMITTSASDPYQ